MLDGLTPNPGQTKLSDTAERSLIASINRSKDVAKVSRKEQIQKPAKSFSIGDSIMSHIAFSENVKNRKAVGLAPVFSTSKYNTLSKVGVNRPTRNNNPLNIKSSEHTRSYSGVAGLDPSPARDGGQFLIFDSPRSGFAAAERLLSTEGYNRLTVDAAMRRWSNNGYGGEILPAFKGRIMATLKPAERSLLVRAMAKREGFNSKIV